MSVLTTKILTSCDDVTAIADGWKQLQARAAFSPFTQYGWFDAWWQNIGKPQGWALHVVAGFRDNRLAALLPLATQRTKGVRKLEWAGAEWFDYCDALAEGPDDAAALWQAAHESRHYDLAIIRDVHAKALSQPALSSFAKLKERKEASYLDITWPSGEAWLQNMPKKKRGVMRRRTNQMEEQKGPVKIEVLRKGPISKELLDTVMRQKTDWLKAMGNKLLFDQPGGKDMFRCLVDASAEEGQLLLGTLTCGGAMVAGHVCFVYKDVLYSYQSSYEQSWSNYSPGTVLLMNMICYAADHGIKRFDHMRGAYAYKDKYSSGADALYDYRFSGSFMGRLAECAQDIKARLASKTNHKETSEEAAD